MSSSGMFSEPSHNFLPYPFKPIVDSYLEKPFFPKDPWDAIQEGDFNKVSKIERDVIIGQFMYR